MEFGALLKELSSAPPILMASCGHVSPEDVGTTTQIARKLASLHGLAPDMPSALRLLLVGHKLEAQPLDVLRAVGATPPVIAIAAVRALDWLEAGAADALAMNAVRVELEPRALAVMRRSQPGLACSRLALDALDRTVVLDGRRIELTQTEFALLHHLHRRPQVWTRTTELLRVASDGVHQDSTLVRVHVCHIREKFQEARLEDPIQSKRTLGYRIRPRYW